LRKIVFAFPALSKGFIDGLERDKPCRSGQRGWPELIK